jgi:hypothetical protein
MQVYKHLNSAQMKKLKEILILIKLAITAELVILYQKMKIYQKLNGGTLYNKIKIAKLPKDNDVCDLKGNIEDYLIEVRG